MLQKDLITDYVCMMGLHNIPKITEVGELQLVNMYLEWHSLQPLGDRDLEAIMDLT